MRDFSASIEKSLPVTESRSHLQFRPSPEPMRQTERTASFPSLRLSQSVFWHVKVAQFLTDIPLESSPNLIENQRENPSLMTSHKMKCHQNLLPLHAVLSLDECKMEEKEEEQQQ